MLRKTSTGFDPKQTFSHGEKSVPVRKKFHGEDRRAFNTGDKGSDPPTDGRRLRGSKAPNWTKEMDPGAAGTRQTSSRSSYEVPSSSVGCAASDRYRTRASASSMRKRPSLEGSYGFGSTTACGEALNAFFT